MMKTLLTRVVLLFSSSVLAEDISDFEIEGMSIGDSLLDYFSESRIKNALNYDDQTPSMKFRIIEIYLESSESDLYSTFQLFYKPEDKYFILFGIIGTVIFKNSINSCYKKQNEVIEELSSMFRKATLEGPLDKKHSRDKSLKSTYKIYRFTLLSGESVDVACYDFSKKMQYPDNLKIGLYSKEVKNWIDNGYN